MKIKIVLVIMTILATGLVMGCIEDSNFTQPSESYMESK